jgi:hypothetical protein
MVYTQEELIKLYDKTSMKFFNSTNKYGLTPSQEEKIKRKMESRRPQPTVLSKSALGSGQRIVTSRVIARYKKNITESSICEEENLIPQEQDHNVEEFINEENNDDQIDQDNEEEEAEEEQEPPMESRTMGEGRYTPVYPGLKGNEKDKFYNEIEHEDDIPIREESDEEDY